MDRHRHTPQLTLASLAALALAACADSHTLAPTAPAASPVATRGGTPNTDITVGFTSTGGVKPTPVLGNTNADGSTNCSSLVPGSTATKIDGATSSTVAGYTFTVSDGGTRLSYALPAGGTQTSLIVGVLVKGGPGYDVYSYAGSLRTSDGGLTSPYNNGGQIPTISHYVVCSVPNGTIKKTLVAVYGTDMTRVDPMSMAIDGMTVPMYAFPAVQPPATTQTLWLEYKIEYSTPVAATITDNEQSVCQFANAAKSYGPNGSFFTCTTNGFSSTPEGSMNGSLGNRTGSITVDPGSGVRYLTVDVHNNGKCGDRPVRNTAVLTAGGLQLGSSSVDTWLWPGHDGC